MHRLEISMSTWPTRFKAIMIINGHLAHQWNQIGKIQNPKLCSPNHISVRDADWFKCNCQQLYFKADWSEIRFLSTVISFLCLCFHFAWKHDTFTCLTHTKKCSVANLQYQSYNLSFTSNWPAIFSPPFTNDQSGTLKLQSAFHKQLTSNVKATVHLSQMTDQ